MFREMRRQDRKTSTERAYNILKSSDHGVFTLFGDDGYPYGIPVNHVVMDGSIYFHAAKEGKKLDSLNLQSKCGFTAVAYNEVIPGKLTTKYASTICMGRASFVEGEEKFDALVMIMKRFAPDFLEESLNNIEMSLKRISIIKITIEHITGKENKVE